MTHQVCPTSVSSAGWLKFFLFFEKKKLLLMSNFLICETLSAKWVETRKNRSVNTPTHHCITLETASPSLTSCMHVCSLPLTSHTHMHTHHMSEGACTLWLQNKNREFCHTLHSITQGKAIASAKCYTMYILGFLGHDNLSRNWLAWLALVTVKSSLSTWWGLKSPWKHTCRGVFTRAGLFKKANHHEYG